MGTTLKAIIQTDPACPTIGIYLDVQVEDTRTIYGVRRSYQAPHALIPVRNEVLAMTDDFEDACVQYLHAINDTYNRYPGTWQEMEL